MTTCLARTALLLLCAFLLLPWSSAQLTGSVGSPGNPNIYFIEITNPTETPVSVLAWNNIFDGLTQLPVLVDVRDDEDNIVPLASTNVMRACMSSADFYTLAPHEFFTRTIDIRQMMQHLPSGPSPPQGAGLTPKVFTIRQPNAFKGVIGDASAVVAALANLGSSPKTLGDMGKSNLQDITLVSNNLRTSNTFPLFPDADPTYLGPADGTHAAANSRAANDSTNTLLPQFIFRNINNLQAVSAIAAAAVNSINGHGPHVDVYCEDVEDLCGNPNILGYSFTPSFAGTAHIVLCPTARALGRTPAPCQTGAVGSASASHILLHLLITLNNVVPTVTTSSINGLVPCHDLASSPWLDATRNLDSLAQVAIAEWGYGFGGPPYNERLACQPTVRRLQARINARPLSGNEGDPIGTNLRCAHRNL
ncbi:MAG: hypothetical protein Q9226_008065 [Calogaya cf. arnoldii]